jgi:LysR family nod box-dependent transcriptional activator
VDEPATSKRHFRIMASDYVINVMLKDALQAVHLPPGRQTLRQTALRRDGRRP